MNKNDSAAGPPSAPPETVGKTEPPAEVTQGRDPTLKWCVPDLAGNPASPPATQPSASEPAFNGRNLAMQKASSLPEALAGNAIRGALPEVIQDSPNDASSPRSESIEITVADGLAEAGELEPLGTPEATAGITAPREPTREAITRPPKAGAVTPPPKPAMEAVTPPPRPVAVTAPARPATEAVTPPPRPAMEAVTPLPKPAMEAVTPPPIPATVAALPKPAMEAVTPLSRPATVAALPKPAMEAVTPPPRPATVAALPKPAMEAVTPRPNPAMEAVTPPPRPATVAALPNPAMEPVAPLPKLATEVVTPSVNPAMEPVTPLLATEVVTPSAKPAMEPVTPLPKLATEAVTPSAKSAMEPVTPPPKQGAVSAPTPPEQVPARLAAPPALQASSTTGAVPETPIRTAETAEVGDGDFEVMDSGEPPSSSLATALTPPPVPGIPGAPATTSQPLQSPSDAGGSGGAAASLAREALSLPEALSRRPLKKRLKPWFEEVFDEDYLRTLPFMTAQQTLRETAFIESALSLPPESELLDIACGYGRHAIELGQRGFRVTGLDLSLPLLIRAADEAQRRGLSVNFVHADMREMTYDSQFAAAYCVLTSFGYFDEETNLRVASSICRAIKPGGRFLVDTINRDYIVSDLPSRVWWEGDGCVVLEEVDFDFHTSRVLIRRSIVFGDGRQVESEISIRAYSLHELGRVLRRAGFQVVDVSGSLSCKEPFLGAASRHVVIVCERPKT